MQNQLIHAWLSAHSAIWAKIQQWFSFQEQNNLISCNNQLLIFFLSTITFASISKCCFQIHTWISSTSEFNNAVFINICLMDCSCDWSLLVCLNIKFIHLLLWRSHSLCGMTDFAPGLLTTCSNSYHLLIFNTTNNGRPWHWNTNSNNASVS